MLKQTVVEETHSKCNVYDITTYAFGVGFCSNTNKPFFFDKEDYSKISKYSWYESRDGHIKSLRNIQIGQVILGSDCEITYLKGDTYDNRKVNLDNAG